MTTLQLRKSINRSPLRLGVVLTGSTLLMLGAAIAGLVFLRWKLLAV
jgi:hypothetical protein